MDSVLSDQKLEEMAGHVAYERLMMWRSRELQLAIRDEMAPVAEQGEEATKAWLLSEVGVDWQIRRNVLLESILLHYRNLLEFLAPALNRMSDDAITAQMFRDVPAPTKYRKRINTLLSHVSKKRADTTLAERIWKELPQMLSEMEAAWQGFLTALAANYPDRVAWFTIYDPSPAPEYGGQGEEV